MKKMMVMLLILLMAGTYSVSYSIEVGQVIPLNDFIRSYLDHSYAVKLKYEDLRSAKGQKLLAESSDEVSLTAEAGYTFANDLVSVPGDNTKGNLFTGQVGVQKQFSASGTIVKVMDGFGAGKIVNSKGSGNQLTLSVIQPVLKNFFGYMTRIPIAQAALSLKAAELNYQETLESAISDAITLYLQWISSYKEKQMLKDIIKNNQVNLNQVRAQLRAGIAEVSDLEIARVSVIQYQQQLSSNQSDYNSLVLQLNDYMPINLDDKPDLNIITNSTMDIPEVDINPNYIRSIRSLNYMLDSGQLSVDSARNAYLPELDIVASYIRADGDNSFMGSYGNASGKNNIYLGAQLTMPLFFMQERGNELQAIAQYEQILLQRDQAVRDIIRNVRVVQDQLKILNEQQQQQKTLIAALKRQVASQTRQFKRGTLNLENLVTGRNNLSNAMLNENTLQIQTVQLYHQYLATIDKLQESYKESIPDGLLLSDNNN